MVLIFGCRSETSDYYYKDEWVSVDNLKVMAAFSRDNADGSKQYVQHVIKMEENGKTFKINHLTYNIWKPLV